MVVVRAIWFVVTLPIRAFYWIIWQARRGGYTLAAVSQRAIGQRNTMLAFALLLALAGLALITGFWECSRRCIAGWEVLEGLIVVGFGAFLAVIAVRRVPNDRRPSVKSGDDYLEYRSEDWRLSWSSVFLVALLVGVFILAWVLSGSG